MDKKVIASEIVKLAKRLVALEFNTQEELEKYKKEHEVRKDTKLTVKKPENTERNTTSLKTEDKPSAIKKPKDLKKYNDEDGFIEDCSKFYGYEEDDDVSYVWEDLLLEVGPEIEAGSSLKNMRMRADGKPSFTYIQGNSPWGAIGEVEMRGQLKALKKQLNDGRGMKDLSDDIKFFDIVEIKGKPSTLFTSLNAKVEVNTDDLYGDLPVHEFKVKERGGKERTYQYIDMNDRVLRDPTAGKKLEILKDKNLDANVLDELADDPISSIRKKVAMHKNVSPETLDKLSYDIDDDVKAAVFKNKKTPSGTIERIYLEAPEKDKEDMLYTALTRGSKEFSKKVFDEAKSIYRLQQVIRLGKPTQEMKDVLDKYWKDKYEAPFVYDSERLSELSKSKMNDVLEELVQNSKFLTDDNLREIAKRGNGRTLYLMPQMQNCPEDLLEKLAKKGVGSALSKTKNSTLISDMYYGGADKEEIAKNENAPLEILKKLGTSSNSEVLMSLMRNKKCPMELVEDVFQRAIDIYDGKTDKTFSGYYGQREFGLDQLISEIAKREDVSSELLDKLSSVSQLWTLKSVAENKNTKPETLQKVSKFDHSYVRSAVIDNNNTSIDTLFNLALKEDEREYMRESAAEKILEREGSEDNFRKLFDLGFKDVISKNSKAPADLLKDIYENGDSGLSAKGNERLKSTALSNPNFPITPGSLLKLSKETQSESIRNGALSNPNFPEEHFQDFLSDSKCHRAIVENPNCPPNILREIAKSINGAEEDFDFERDVVFNSLLHNPKTPNDVLKRFGDEYSKGKHGIGGRNKAAIQYMRNTFDINKLPPETRERVKNMSREELDSFLLWLFHKND